MVYETKLPRQVSASTGTEDFSEDSEVSSFTRVFKKGSTVETEFCSRGVR